MTDQSHDTSIAPVSGGAGQSLQSLPGLQNLASEAMGRLFLDVLSSGGRLVIDATQMHPTISAELNGKSVSTTMRALPYPDPAPLPELPPGFHCRISPEGLDALLGAEVSFREVATAANRELATAK